MSSLLKSTLRRGALMGASLLDTGAATLRGLVRQEPEPVPERETPAPAAAPTAPPAGTRSRIANPKAARKVRARQ